MDVEQVSFCRVCVGLTSVAQLSHCYYLETNLYVLYPQEMCV